MFGRIFGGRRPSNELNEATANFKKNFGELQKSLANKGIQPKLSQVEGVFNYQKNGQKSTINKIKIGLAKRILAAIGGAQSAQVAAAAGVIPQAQAARQVRQANRVLTQIAATNFYYYPTNTNNKVYNKNGKNRNNKKLNRATMTVSNRALLGEPGAAAAGAALPPSGPVLPTNVKQASNAPGVYFKKSNNGRNVWFPAALNKNTGNWVIMNKNAPHSKNNQNKFTPVGETAV